MKIISRVLVTFVFVAMLVSLFSCGNDESPTQKLPTGCQNQGVNAIAVLKAGLQCVPTNAFRDVNQALGGPDASKTGDGKTQLSGIVSIGVGGSITLFMGACIQDLPGPDIRVYQAVADEPVQVEVAANMDGPFTNLGQKNCGEPSPFFSGKCDFDLAGTGLNNVRVVRVTDTETSPSADCDTAGLSPGADIDAVEVLHPGS